MFNFKLNIKSDSKRDYKAERAQVAQLILNVLCETASVKDVLLHFPKDTDDKSVIAAWHALSHYEADEELRAKSPEYKTEQNDYLEFIAFTLRDNNDLPENIVSAYDKYYKGVPIADNKSFLGKWHKLIRFINID